MHDQIKVVLDKKREIICKKGTTVKELLEISGSDEDIIAASVDGEIVELSYELNDNCKLEFIRMYDKVGGKIYRAGLQFVYIVAVKELYGDKVDVCIKHSLDKAIYTTINAKLTAKDVNNIKKKMQEIIDLDIEIKKSLVSKRKAIDYFKKHGEPEKVNLYHQISNSYVTFYELLGHYNYFYYYLPYSTGILKIFDLKLVKPNGVILMYPKGKENIIPPYHHCEKLLDLFRDYEERMEKGWISYASDVNSLAINGGINEFIKINEMLLDDLITKAIWDAVNKKSIKMILIGGPSCSGKTTTSKKVALKLKEFGRNPFVISLDDYYKERVDTPKDENGDYDFETIDAIDVKLFNNHLKRLLEFKPVKMPTFNFLTGEKEYKKPEVTLRKNDIIVVEGLHTLNEELTKKISRNVKYKIYVSPFTPLGMDRHNHISSTDVRLLRRIVRDNRTRGYSAQETIKRWKIMRNSEEKYVYPYQYDGDALINTALMYEINALRTFVEPLLYSVDPDSDDYEEARRLIVFIRNFFSIPDKAIPETSVLREFIGDSYFE